MNDKQKAKVQKYFDRGMKWEEISIITGVEVDDIKALCDTKPKTVAEQKKTIEAVTKKVEKPKYFNADPKATTRSPVQTATKTEGFSTKTGLHTATPKAGGTEE